MPNLLTLQIQLLLEVLQIRINHYIILYTPNGKHFRPKNSKYIF